MCTCVCSSLQRLSEGSRSPGAAVQGGGELLDMGAGVEMGLPQSRPLLIAGPSPQPQRYLPNNTLNMYKGCRALMLAARSKSVVLVLHYAGSAGQCLTMSLSMAMHLLMTSLFCIPPPQF